MKQKQSASSASEFSRRATHGGETGEPSRHRRNAVVRMDTKSSAQFMKQLKSMSRVVCSEFWLFIGQNPYSMIAFELSLLRLQLSPLQQNL